MLFECMFESMAQSVAFSGGFWTVVNQNFSTGLPGLFRGGVRAVMRYHHNRGVADQ
jgi:hypothetical protein